MNDNNRNLLVRIATAALALPIVVFLLWKGGYWSASLLAWAAATCAGEYYLITQKRLSVAGWLGVVLAAAMPVLPVWRPEFHAALSFWLIASFLFLSYTFHLVRGPLDAAPVLTAHLVTGLVYASAGLTALAALRQGQHGLEWVLIALAVTWANDTAAYFAGRLLGRHKLYVAVSPNKTWEGFFGGLLGSVGAAFASRYTFFGELSVLDCLIVGVLGGVFGPLGDLCESMLKRAYGVKDSGRIIPGHGGLLDRIDALLFNAPVLYVYATFVR